MQTQILRLVSTTEEYAICKLEQATNCRSLAPRRTALVLSQIETKPRLRFSRQINRGIMPRFLPNLGRKASRPDCPAVGTTLAFARRWPSIGLSSKPGSAREAG
jgi:hypothetical protein